jgi:hypothetical protein
MTVPVNADAPRDASTHTDVSQALQIAVAERLAPRRRVTSMPAGSPDARAPLAVTSMEHSNTVVRLRGAIVAALLFPTLFLQTHLAHAQAPPLTYEALKNLAYTLSGGASMTLKDGWFDDESVLVQFEHGYIESNLGRYAAAVLIEARNGHASAYLHLVRYVDGRPFAFAPTYVGEWPRIDGHFMTGDSVEFQTALYESGAPLCCPSRLRRDLYGPILPPSGGSILDATGFYLARSFEDTVRGSTGNPLPRPVPTRPTTDRVVGEAGPLPPPTGSAGFADQRSSNYASWFGLLTAIAAAVGLRLSSAQRGGRVKPESR